MPKTPYIVKIPRDNEIFGRPMVFVGLEEDWSVKSLDVIEKPKNQIICDGCNTLIEDEEILCLVFSEGYIHSCQCPECVEKYFSTYKQYTWEEINK